MSMKKTDLDKNMALKLGGRMKSAGVPKRFAEGAAEVAKQRDQRRAAEAVKLVPMTCRLPADLVRQLRERAMTHEGGMNALMATLLSRA